MGALHYGAVNASPVLGNPEYINGIDGRSAVVGICKQRNGLFMGIRSRRDVDRLSLHEGTAALSGFVVLDVLDL